MSGGVEKTAIFYFYVNISKTVRDTSNVTNRKLHIRFRFDLLTTHISSCRPPSQLYMWKHVHKWAENNNLRLVFRLKELRANEVHLDSQISGLAVERISVRRKICNDQPKC